MIDFRCQICPSWINYCFINVYSRTTSDRKTYLFFSYPLAWFICLFVRSLQYVSTSLSPSHLQTIGRRPHLSLLTEKEVCDKMMMPEQSISFVGLIQKGKGMCFSLKNCCIFYFLRVTDVEFSSHLTYKRQNLL